MTHCTNKATHSITILQGEQFTRKKCPECLDDFKKMADPLGIKYSVEILN